MGGKPVFLPLRPGAFGIDQPRAWQAGDENLNCAFDALVQDGERVAGIIDLHRLAGAMDLTHRQAAPRRLLPFLEQQLELAELVAVGMVGLVLTPQKLTRDVLVPPQFLVDLGPIRHRPPTVRRRWEQRRFQRLVAQARSLRRVDPGRPCPLEISPQRRTRYLRPDRHRTGIRPKLGP